MGSSSYSRYYDIVYLTFLSLSAQKPPLSSTPGAPLQLLTVQGSLQWQRARQGGIRLQVSFCAASKVPSVGASQSGLVRAASAGQQASSRKVLSPSLVGEGQQHRAPDPQCRLFGALGRDPIRVGKPAASRGQCGAGAGGHHQSLGQLPQAPAAPHPVVVSSTLCGFGQGLQSSFHSSCPASAGVQAEAAWLIITGSSPAPAAPAVRPDTAAPSVQKFCTAKCHCPAQLPPWCSSPLSAATRPSGLQSPSRRSVRGRQVHRQMAWCPSRRAACKSVPPGPDARSTDTRGLQAASIGFRQAGGKHHRQRLEKLFQLG